MNPVEGTTNHDLWVKGKGHRVGDNDIGGWVGICQVEKGAL